MSATRYQPSQDLVLWDPLAYLEEEEEYLRSLELEREIFPHESVSSVGKAHRVHTRGPPPPPPRGPAVDNSRGVVTNPRTVPKTEGLCTRVYKRPGSELVYTMNRTTGFVPALRLQVESPGAFPYYAYPYRQGPVAVQLHAFVHATRRDKTGYSPDRHRPIT